MTNNKYIPHWAWDFYQAKQEEALNRPTDATEETLNFLGRTFAAGRIPVNLSVLQHRVDNYLAGNRQKVRRRLQLLENNLDMVVPPAKSTNPTEDYMEVIQRNVSPTQWRLLNGLAQGDSYRRLSAECGMSVTSAKSTVCRIRKKLRTLAFAE